MIKHQRTGAAMKKISLLLITLLIVIFLFGCENKECEFVGCKNKASTMQSDGFYACSKHSNNRLYKAWE